MFLARDSQNNTNFPPLLPKYYQGVLYVKIEQHLWEHFTIWGMFPDYGYKDAGKRLIWSCYPVTEALLQILESSVSLKDPSVNIIHMTLLILLSDSV